MRGAATDLTKNVAGLARGGGEGKSRSNGVSDLDDFSIFISGRDHPAGSHAKPHAFRACCTVGEELTVVDSAAEAESAFDGCDADWAPSLQRYLGTSGVVEQVDDTSVLVRHGDGQRIWWAYRAVHIRAERAEPPRNDEIEKNNLDSTSSSAYLSSLAEAAIGWLRSQAAWYQHALWTSAMIFLVSKTRSMLTRQRDFSAGSKPRRSPAQFMHHDRWSDALFLNFPVDPSRLQALLPAGLEVDTQEGQAWVSFVALTEQGISPMFACLPRGLQQSFKLGHRAVNVRTCKRRILTPTDWRARAPHAHWCPRRQRRAQGPLGGGARS